MSLTARVDRDVLGSSPYLVPGVAAELDEHVYFLLGHGNIDAVVKRYIRDLTLRSIFIDEIDQRSF